MPSSVAGAPTQPLTFPGLLAATEAQSAVNQKTFFASRAAEFTALALAAGLGAIPREALNGMGPGSALFLFAVALVIRVSGVGDKAERRWYDARAAAESIKSAAWQFAVGGEAFRISDRDASGRFLRAQQDVLKALPNLEVPVDASSSAITTDMLRVRESPLQDRVGTYQVGRVTDQRNWYADNARINGRRAKQWRWILIAIEGLACLLGLLRALGAGDVDWLGIFGTLAAGVAAWKQTRNYSFLSESYSVTSHEVALVASSLSGPHDEDAWAQAVHDAEAAFSREHTLWLARRQGPPA